MVSPRKQASAVFAFAFGLALTGWTGSALAQQANEDAVRKAFTQADDNRDGVLNLDEYVGHIIYVFRRVDTNRDGFISVEEAIAFNPVHNAANMKAVDRNGDARLSVSEVASAKVYDFFEMDTNRDGVVTIEELIIYERRATPRPAAAK